MTYDHGYRTTNGLCYIFSVPSGYCKIGFCRDNDPDGRRRALQTGNHEIISFEGATLLDPHAPICAREVERMMHTSLEAAGYHRRGEWFKVGLDEILVHWNELRAKRKGQ